MEGGYLVDNLICRAKRAGMDDKEQDVAHVGSLNGRGDSELRFDEDGLGLVLGIESVRQSAGRALIEAGPRGGLQQIGDEGVRVRRLGERHHSDDLWGARGGT
jgi:hypothetical protein